MIPDGVLRLDVGGAIFLTTKQTLMKRDSYFKRMLDSNRVRLDEFGCLFVDRSPKHFELILNYLRDGRTPIPPNALDRAQLLNEAKYYMLEGLVYLCGGDPSSEWKKEHFPDAIRLTTSMDDFYTFERQFDRVKAITIHFDSRRWGDITENIHILDFMTKHGQNWEIMFFNRTTQVDFIHLNLPKRERWQFLCLGTIYNIPKAIEIIEDHMTLEHAPLDSDEEGEVDDEIEE